MKSEGLWFRGKTEGELTASRLGLNVRDELRLSTRTFVFVQNQYLRDEFMSIHYLLAAGSGFGYKQTLTATSTLNQSVAALWKPNDREDAL